MKKFLNSKSTESKQNIQWATSGLSDNPDPLSRNWPETLPSLQDRECWMPCSLQFWEEPVLFPELLVVARPVSHKLFPSTPTPISLSTSVVVREETKWLKCWKNSPPWPQSRTANPLVSCKGHHWSPTPLTCLWLPERPVSILVLPLLNISETWVEMFPWWLTLHPDGPKPWEKSQVVLLKCLVILVILPILPQNWPSSTKELVRLFVWVHPTETVLSPLWVLWALQVVTSLIPLQLQLYLLYRSSGAWIRNSLKRSTSPQSTGPSLPLTTRDNWTLISTSLTRSSPVLDKESRKSSTKKWNLTKLCNWSVRTPSQRIKNWPWTLPTSSRVSSFSKMLSQNTTSPVPSKKYISFYSDCGHDEMYCDLLRARH